jgi:hypothetical protein
VSDRHLHVTSFIYQADGLEEFLGVLRKHFRTVTPIIRDTGQVIAVAFESKDLGDIGDELYTLPEAVEELSGILSDDIQIVSAWEGEEGEPPFGHERQRVWQVKGRGTG